MFFGKLITQFFLIESVFIIEFVFYFKIL